MSERNPESNGKLGFLDSLGRLFRGRPEEDAPAPQDPPQAGEGFGRLEADFAGAIRALNERVEEIQRSSVQTADAAGPARATTEDRAALALRRAAESHEAIREDIEKMHERLGTGLSGADLDAIVAFLTEIADEADAGSGSQELIPRARHAIAERLGAEAGQLAVARLIALLERQGMDWPDPTHHRPSATLEEIERSRRRRLSDVRESFLAHDLRRTSERLRGIVRGWGGDYPYRGSASWEEAVLEGVGAGIRGQLIRDFVELLRSERDLLLSRTEDAVGKETASLQKALASGVQTVEQARLAVAASLRVLDEVVPEIAWEMVSSRLPEARGEFPGP